MKITRNIYITIFILITFGVNAQRHELGLRLGMSHLVGDVGRTDYLLQMPFTHNFNEFGFPFYGGVVYRMNFNPYQTLRFNLGYSHIQFDDAASKEEYRRKRGVKGTNAGVELDALFEYNFYPVNNEQKGMLSPYIFGGIGGMVYGVKRLTINHDFNRNPAGDPLPPMAETDFTTTANYSIGSRLVLSIPFGIGLKYKFNYNWALSGELMFRPTFSDGIDYSLIDNKDIKIIYNKDLPSTTLSGNHSLLKEEPYIYEAKLREIEIINKSKVGNPNSKDWVNSITLSLTYSFGRPPCYCD